ncbi:hypothetical protein [Streptomyces sp. NPDC059176]|uniref:hypothetical protein n=1 Tax=Streptomyces sp. NPDC059176 TaxID=3346758 RepID=UPI00369748B1
MGATACSRLGTSPAWRARAERLGRVTAAEQLSGRYAGLWRYEFDVQTRWGYYPASMPNIVATTFCADGCLDTGALSEHGVESLATGLLEQLFTGRYFAYTPVTGTLIHNANLMGAALAARLAGRIDVPRPLASRLRDAACASVSASIAAQRSDGSWPYGDASGLGWVDGFHTGYVLLRLESAAAELGLDVDAAMSAGARFYFTSLFDGAVPRYYAGQGSRRGTAARRDPNNDATALRMAAWGEDRGHVPPGFADDVWAAVTGHFPDCAPPASRRRRVRPIDRSPRWATAPLLDALTAVYAIRSEE